MKTTVLSLLLLALLQEKQTQAQSLLYFDSDSARYNRDNGEREFEGNFVAIGAGVLLAADHVLFNTNEKKLTATGHVIVLTGEQLFVGEKVSYFVDSGDFSIEQAVMSVNDKARVEQVLNQVMGITQEELDFELARKARLEEVKLEKAAQQKNAKSVMANPAQKQELTNRYFRLLEQEQKIQQQLSPSLARTGDERRTGMTKRRDYWNGVKGAFAKKATQTYFLKIAGDEIGRTNGNDYRVREALLTPCKCEDDESPAWGLRSERTEAQLGGYADLHHPVLEIKGIPILYLPYLKIPIKDKRQSGLLMPLFESNRRSGSIISQPVFFALDDHYDATMNLDFFEKRGTRLGGEFRVQTSQYTGWDVNVEGIRDSLWVESRATRQDLFDLYTEGAKRANAREPYAPGPSDREALRATLSRPETWRGMKGYEDCISPDGMEPSLPLMLRCEEKLSQAFSIPPNTMRGSYSWNGRSFLTQRLSLVSHGKINSDHSYEGDFKISDANMNSVFADDIMPVYALTATEAQFDGRDLYFSVGNRYLDFVKTTDRFSDRQIPGKVRIQTRMFPILEIPGLGSRIFQDFRLESMKIDQFNAPTPGPEEVLVREGDWSKLTTTSTVPLLPRSVLDLDADLAFNQIWAHSKDLSGSSAIGYWRFGLGMQLPITGDGAVDWSDENNNENKNQEPLPSQKVFRHQADFALRYDVVPEVSRRGEYAEVVMADSHQAYFPREDTTLPSRTASFSMSHTWGSFDRRFARLAAKSSQNEEPDLWQQAERELYGPYSAVRSFDDLLREEDWILDRFAVLDSGSQQFASWVMRTGYDFEEARRKKYDKNNVRILNTPWRLLDSTLVVSFFNATLSGNIKYDLNLKATDSTGFVLTSPTYLRTFLRGEFARDYILSAASNIAADVVDSTVLTINTSPMNAVALIAGWRQNLPKGGPVSHATDYKIEYKDSSECWGLYLERTESISRVDRTQTYILRLIVDFLGQTRPLGDFRGLTNNWSGSRSEAD